MFTEQTIPLDDVLKLALRLSPRDKIKLVERMASTLEKEIVQPLPLDTLEGLFAHLGPGPSDEDIAEIRREMWSNFPREDIV